MCELTITGLAFLWHQIRCIVTVLFLVGQGNEKPQVSIHVQKPQVSIHVQNLRLTFMYKNLRLVFMYKKKPWVSIHVQKPQVSIHVQNSYKNDCIVNNDINWYELKNVI